LNARIIYPPEGGEWKLIPLRRLNVRIRSFQQVNIAAPGESWNEGVERRQVHAQSPKSGQFAKVGQRDGGLKNTAT
jgi:hypothetical protein